MKIIAVFSLFLFGSLEGSLISQGKAPWTHQFVPQDHRIKVEWRNEKDPKTENNPWLEVQVTARTGGYVGVGFSPNGGMNGADMMIAWVDQNGPHVFDFHGVGNQPVLDMEQNWELLDGSEDDGWTRIKFRRKWETCDEEHDMIITNDTVRLIYAMGKADPRIQENGDISRLDWHGVDGRGVQSVFLKDDAFPSPFPDDRPDLYPQVKIWDMTMEDNKVDAEHTTYFCKIVKFPFLDRKHHMIGWKPILTPENKANVHHIVFYECMIPPEHGGTESVFEAHTTHSGGRCYTKNMPPEWTKHCVTFLFVWVAGSEGEMFPEHVGSPLGEEHGGATYFMMEVHYDNPTHRTFTDRSGVRIFYTDQLRENDGSVILMGYRITPFLLLPPKQPNFVTHGICSSECTEMTVPSTGIHIINTLEHAHLNGRKLRLRHFRQGKELPIIAEDNYYDFNYQQSRTLQNEVTILPGDELITECEYETTDNNRIVLGGLSTTQEMCQSFFVYYPRINLMQCTSQVEFHDFFKHLGVDSVDGKVLESIKMPYDPSKLTPEELEFDPPDNAKELEETGDGASFKSVFDYLTVTEPRSRRGRSVGDLLKEMNWTDTKMAKKIEKQWQHSKHYAYCTGHGRKKHALKNYIIDYPTITEPLKKSPSRICEGSNKGRVGKAFSSSAESNLFSPIMLLISAFAAAHFCIN